MKEPLNWISTVIVGAVCIGLVGFSFWSANHNSDVNRIYENPPTKEEFAEIDLVDAEVKSLVQSDGFMTLPLAERADKVVALLNEKGVTDITVDLPHSLVLYTYPCGFYSGVGI